MPLLKLFRLVPFVILLVTVPPVASSTEDDLELEINRFLKAYRLSEIGVESLRLSLLEAAKRGNVTDTYAQCVLDALSPTMFETAVFAIAREQLTDVTRLKEINSFFESSVGKKLVDQLQSLQLTDVRREAAGLKPVLMPRLQLTANELQAIQDWESKASYRDFIAFIDVGLAGAVSSAHFQTSFSGIRKKCVRE